jgi:hypothetical protein
VIQTLRDFLSPPERRIIGAEAQQLLDNRHFKDAFDAVEAYVIERAKATDTTKPGLAENVVITLQLLEALKREIVRKVEDGEMAKVEIQELEKRGSLRRFVR